MVIDTDLRGAVIWRLVRLLALVPISASLSHDAIFLAQYGAGDAYRAAMTRTGHGYWPVFGLLVAALALWVVGRGLRRIRQLRAHRHECGGRRQAPPALPGTGPGTSRHAAPHYRRELALVWLPLYPLTVLFFTVQENLESFAASGHLAGLDPLIGADHFFAIPILALVSFVIGAAGALLRWRVAVLEHRLAQSRARGRSRRHAPDRPAAGWRSIAAICAHRWILARLDAGRAPPAVA